jgi:hypothetical protein
MRPADLRLRWATHQARLRLNAQVRRMEAHLEQTAAPAAEAAPVLLFNASTRIHRLSLNAAFGLFAGWAVRGAGVPTAQLVCRRGMLQCPLGTHWAAPQVQPPCTACILFSQALFPIDRSWPFAFHEAGRRATAELDHAPLPDLVAWEWDGLKLGELCLPALRWVMRRHDLEDGPPVRQVLRQYLASAVSLALVARDAIDRLRPRAAVVFNGLMFPEATVRAVARRSGLPVITHEVGLAPMSAFFSHQEATFRQLEPPARLELDEDESARLDGYLSERFEGRFSMAGIRFWPEIQPPPAPLLKAIEHVQSVVTVFTNVIFDTSQVHANSLFPSMFAWLDDLLAVIGPHRETLFIIRAHPDEDRPGKASRQSVSDWVRQHELAEWPNIYFFGPSDYVNSYALIQRSKFVLVYNSSVGLEATLLGVPVLCAGRARFTQWPTVTFPATRAEYDRTLHAFLDAPVLTFDETQRVQARRFLHDELFRESVDLSRFLQPFDRAPGMVQLEPFLPKEFLESAEARLLAEGILQGKPFRYPESGSR